MPNDFGFGFGDIVDAVGTSLSDLASAIFNAVVDAVNFLFQAISFTWQVLLGNLEFQAEAWPRVQGVFNPLIIFGFGGFLGKLMDWLHGFWDALKRIFDPIICAIKAIIDYHDFLYNKYLRPVLILIQRMRSFLTLLRLLHVKWAARLDARLAEVEGRIAAVFLDVRRELNTIRGTISLFIDPFGLFDQATLALSAIRSAGDLWAVVKSVGARPLTASEQDQQKANRHYMTVAWREEQTNAAAQGLPGDFAAEDAYRLAVINAAVSGQPVPEG